MKKILILLAVAGSISAFGQSTRTGTFLQYNGAGTHVTSDTATNNDTTSLWNGRFDNDQWDVAFKFLTTQLTGTITPTTIVQGSEDATTITNGTWVTLKNCTTCQAVGLSDTGAARTTVYDYFIPECHFKAIRLRMIQSGTGTSITTGSYWLSAPFQKGL